MTYPKRTSLYVYIIEPICAERHTERCERSATQLTGRIICVSAHDKSAELGGGSAVFSFFFLGFFGDISRLGEGDFGENGSAQLIYED